MKLFAMLSVMCACALFAQPYFIKGPENPKPHEATAVKELQDYLGRRIEGSLKIGGKSPITFHVGDSEFAKKHGILSDKLEDERWVIRQFGNDVVINGGGTRGALYATFHFLEDCCGIHWWSNHEEHVPKASSLSIGKLDVTGKPVLLYRDIYASPRFPQDAVTAIRVRLNRCGDTPIPAEWGGSFNYGPPDHCHTFDHYVPLKEYAETHPEYYSLRDGRRVIGENNGGQVCLTNPALKQIFLDNLRKFIAKGEEAAKKAGVQPPRIYDISMNDTQFRCECENCRAEEEKYNPSGFYLNFINWLAGEIAKEHPEIYISTLAYHYTEPPPKGGVRAADNVIVKLCDTKTNQAASIKEDFNKIFLDFLVEWKNHARNLFVWDYAIVFQSLTGMPFASEFHYGDLYRTYHENNVTGIFWEHEWYFLADMYELKFFLETKLAENPYQDENKLINTFMDCYYGAAGRQVLAIRREIDRIRKAKGGVATWTPSVGSFAYLKDDMARLQAMYDKAEETVKDDELLKARVRHSRLGLDRLTCFLDKKLIYHGRQSNANMAVLDSSKAKARMEESWEAWYRKVKAPEDQINSLKREIASHENIAVQTVPVPKELEGRSFYDFFAGSLKVWNKNTQVLVDDPEAASGKAIRIDVPSNVNHYFDLPFAIGFYDDDAAQSLGDKKFSKIPDGPGYHWYKLDAPVKIPQNGLFYMTREWTTQLKTGYPELIGRTFEIWASAKFTGKQFHPEQVNEHEYIFIDRVVLIEPEK
ncbi:MAG: DUF4838 domain-containing protein [Victivallales bacterium]|nr:DUF4838 domain-containing protein [Victivallales bacterium]